MTEHFLLKTVKSTPQFFQDFLIQLLEESLWLPVPVAFSSPGLAKEYGTSSCAFLKSACGRCEKLARVVQSASPRSRWILQNFALSTAYPKPCQSIRIHQNQVSGEVLMACRVNARIETSWNPEAGVLRSGLGSVSCYLPACACVRGLGSFVVNGAVGTR